MGISNCDNVVRSDENAWRGLQNGIPRIQKCNFPDVPESDSKNYFFELILIFYPTKRENAFEKLNHICFVTWAVTENPNFGVFVVSLSRKKTD